MPLNFSNGTRLCTHADHDTVGHQQCPDIVLAHVFL